MKPFFTGAFVVLSVTSIGLVLGAGVAACTHATVIQPEQPQQPSKPPKPPQRRGIPVPYCVGKSLLITSAFVVECVEKGGDPEDCHKVGKALFCAEVDTFYREGERVPCVLATTCEEKETCGFPCEKKTEVL